MFVQELLLATLTEQLNLSVDVEAEESSSTVETILTPESEGEQGAGCASSSQKENKNLLDSSSKSHSSRTAESTMGGEVERSPLGVGARSVTAGTGAFRDGSWGHGGSAGSAGHSRQVCSPITVSNSRAVHDFDSSLGQQGVGMMQGREGGRASSGRERGLNPASAKRSMLKHMPPQRGASDTDPPPH